MGLTSTTSEGTAATSILAAPSPMNLEISPDGLYQLLGTPGFASGKPSALFPPGMGRGASQTPSPSASSHASGPQKFPLDPSSYRLSPSSLAASPLFERSFP